MDIQKSQLTATILQNSITCFLKIHPKLTNKKPIPTNQISKITYEFQTAGNQQFERPQNHASQSSCRPFAPFQLPCLRDPSQFVGVSPKRLGILHRP